MSELDELKKEAVERIYLVPHRDEGRLCYLWCEDPAPGEGMKEEEAVEYIRADVADQQLTAERERADALAAHVERIDALAKAARSSSDSEFLLAVEGMLQVIESLPENSLAQRDARVAAEAIDKLSVLIGAGATLAEITDYVADEIAAGGGHDQQST